MTWLKKSRWSLLAFVIAVPVAVLSALSIRFIPDLATTNPHPVMLEQGDIGTYKKVTFQLVDHKVVKADSDQGRELGALAGTEVVIVTLHVDATNAGKGIIGCDFALTAPGPAGQREWDSNQLEVSLPYGGDDYESYCILSDKKSFNLKQLFVVPEGVASTVSLWFRPSDLEPPALQWDW